jgi:hypothetical protein
VEKLLIFGADLFYKNISAIIKTLLHKKEKDDMPKREMMLIHSSKSG